MVKKVEIFNAGCSACKSTIELVNELACNNCEINILDMNDSAISSRADELGITRIPAVVVNGKLADCCQSNGPRREGLKAAGIGS